MSGRKKYIVQNFFLLTMQSYNTEFVAADWLPWQKENLLKNKV